MNAVKTGTSSKTFTTTINFYEPFVPNPRPNEEPAAYVARVARTVRKQFNLTQEQVAEKSKGKFTQAYISRVESAKWQSIKKVNRYLRGYGVSMTFELSDLEPQGGE